MLAVIAYAADVADEVDSCEVVDVDSDGAS